MKKIRLAVLFGGMSSEHEVSCVSASSVLKNLDKDKYEIYKVGMTKDGRWFLTDASEDEIADRSWEEKDNTPAFISPDRGNSGIIVLENGEFRRYEIDCIFPVVHGRNCEDGVLQGLLDLSGIPYIGPGVASSACSMDKSITKLIISQTDVKQADFVLISADEVRNELEKACSKVEEHFEGVYPFFIKPANEGSSVGISKVHDRAELEKGLTLAATYDERILVEETIVGREIETAVLGNSDPEVGRVGEVFAANEFYDYESKYNNIGSETKMVEDLPEEKIEEIKKAAVTVFNAMGCRCLSRVDFFLSDKNEVIFNELNTLPGFTSISMYPMMWDAAGLKYSDLLDKLVELAME